jgi:hypothetical protein
MAEDTVGTHKHRHPFCTVTYHFLQEIIEFVNKFYLPPWRCLCVPTVLVGVFERPSDPGKAVGFFWSARPVHNESWYL